MKSWTVTLIIRADDSDDRDLEQVVCDELPAWLVETHGIETVLAAFGVVEGDTADRVASSPALLAINADPSFWDAKARPYGTCEVCEEPVSEAEDRALRADIDFVEHGDGHLIRRMWNKALSITPSGVSA